MVEYPLLLEHGGESETRPNQRLDFHTDAGTNRTLSAPHPSTPNTTRKPV